MAHYRQVGEVPPKRHTQFRRPDGGLYSEELMGEEGFSSDSSLLYHRGIPSALVDARPWQLPDQTLTPNAPLVDDVGDDDMSMVFKTSAEQSAPASIEQEPARSWFQRLFGV